MGNKQEAPGKGGDEQSCSENFRLRAPGGPTNRLFLRQPFAETGVAPSHPLSARPLPEMNHPFSHLLRGLALLIDGALAMTTGFAAEAPSLSILPLNPLRPDEVDLAFDKPAGCQMFAEESGNLSKWTFLSRFWAGDGMRESLSLPRESPGRFFRLSAYPNPQNEWVTATANTNNAAYRLFFSHEIGRPVSFHILLPAAYSSRICMGVIPPISKPKALGGRRSRARLRCRPASRSAWPSAMRIRC